MAQAARAHVVHAVSRVPLREGQSVVLDLAPGTLARISLSLYLLPAIGFLAGAFLATNWGLADLGQAVAGIVGLFVGLSIARRCLRRQFGEMSPLSAVQVDKN